jgi:hypothetical protein
MLSVLTPATSLSSLYKHLKVQILVLLCVASGERMIFSENLGTGFWSHRGCRNKLTIDRSTGEKTYKLITYV